MKTVINEGESTLGSDNIMTRSFDGRLSKVTLPDKSIIYSYKEKRKTADYNTFTFNTVTLIYRFDGTIIKIQQDGEVVIITAEEREKMSRNDSDEGKSDDNYMSALFGEENDRKGGVYSCSLKKSKLWTKDYENNIFEVHADGTMKVPDFNLVII